MPIIKREMIHTNPTVLIDVPKIHEKALFVWILMKIAMLLGLL